MGRGDQIDLVSSHVYPTLERKPGGPDNWVEATGGLPKYIERIAKHLHYEQGMTISRSIAVAVNTVKRWAVGGLVAEHGTTKRVSAKTQALAVKALAEWESKKARAHLQMSIEQEIARRVDLATALQAEKQRRIDLALTKDGRKSFKNQGRWRHGFVPVDGAAKKAKAKGSPIAMKRMERLYGKASSGVRDTVKAAKKGASTERTSSGRVAQLRRAITPDSSETQRLGVVKRRAEASKGGGSTARSSKPWNEIPEAQKVTRNGKRYVLSIYKGKQQLVEWTGQNADVPPPDPNQRRFLTLRSADAMQMTTAQIRRMLKTPGQTPETRKVLNAALRAKTKGKM